jgi:hypothetical protein
MLTIMCYAVIASTASAVSAGPLGMLGRHV